MSTEIAFLVALELCEQAPSNMPAEQIVQMAANQVGVDPDALLDLWLRKQYACQAARHELAGEREGAA